ncbi:MULTISPECIES: hypothetical protein [Bacillus subtilis group]|uniref:hypothetical protein n=1 Tax=Bacillus subtilis group TaxID=653685 RepID=UPI000C7665C3|nr:MULTISPECIES: hypothetical protein [Bacillus subtilis group]MED4337995.1 hypothetical protein [Bacillus licheniformis]MED4371001.1 hypothetical protein [Bacillus licheniformis]PLC14060.1 hypothetical protein BV582_21040 [Bacillus paralicheniformis]QAS18635.1 hypothetical protein EQJ69_22165 [Bacillus licheniformis]GIN55135.1 hypothetical protein J36TS2_40290 [Bacillus paralicheniformis]
MNSVQDLANYFVYHITQSTVGIEGRIKSALTSIPKLLDKGWTLGEIKDQLDLFAYTYPQIATNLYHIDEIMNHIDPPNNLMEKDVFYYHSELREMSSPPKIIRDKQSGELVRKTEDFYLEMKSRYTLQDLMNYWYKKMNIQPTDHMMKQDEGKFKYILGNYTLDEVLFSIDASVILRKERQQRLLRNAFELDKYIEDARELIRRKENVHKIGGINREFRREQTVAYH